MVGGEEDSPRGHPVGELQVPQVVATPWGFRVAGSEEGARRSCPLRVAWDLDREVSGRRRGPRAPP